MTPKLKPSPPGRAPAIIPSRPIAQSRVADNWTKNQPTPNATRLWYKDLMLALECADELGLALPGTAMAQELIELINPEEDRQ